MKREDKQQFTLRITQANPTELVVILYEMLLCYLQDAREALTNEQEGEFREALRKARGCLNELLGSLNLKYDPAPVLQQLYIFCVKRLALAQSRRSAELLGEIEHVIVPLCDSYRELAKQNCAGPVMNNSQTVYAGLTYGRNTLTENMAYQSTNRGMLV